MYRWCVQAQVGISLEWDKAGPTVDRHPQGSPSVWKGLSRHHRCLLPAHCISSLWDHKGVRVP